MYEEALPPAYNVYERKKFLEFFAVWALLKKEVSVTFLMALLEGWSEETIIYYINKYSKWFNSPQSGKYVLYLERLRAFILQKISKQQFNACNETIIKVSNDALSRRSGDEWENYALEYLSNHMLIPAIEKGEGSVLKLLAYNTTHWNRQLQISKSFEWSKRMLNDMMLWASKYDKDEVIECALNKVDLHHLEQNDAPRIVELVAQNDIETALQRIEAFGGKDKEGLQRKFILYMLCLMDLTLLDSKDKPFRKGAIEKLLKHLDENLPVDHSVLNWNDFFPSYLMFIMASEWAGLGIDYLNVYKRTNTFENDWVKECGLYNDTQFEVLFESAKAINDNKSKNITLNFISNELAKQGKIDFALKCTQDICDYAVRSSSLISIYSELAKNIESDFAASLMNEVLDCTSRISNMDEKIQCLLSVSNKLNNYGKLEVASSLMQDALQYARDIGYEPLKSKVLMKISSEFLHQGNKEKSDSVIKEAFECEKGILDLYKRTSTLIEISEELSLQGKMDEAFLVLEEAIKLSNDLIDDSEKNWSLRIISIELAKQFRIDKAIEFANYITDEYDKILALIDISNECINQGKIEVAISCSFEIGNEYYDKSVLLKNIAIKLSKDGKVAEALGFIKRIPMDLFYLSEKINAMKGLSNEITKQGNIKLASAVLQQTLDYTNGINDFSFKDQAFKNISYKFTKKGKIENATELANSIIDILVKSQSLLTISLELAKQGKTQKATECAIIIPEDSYKSCTFSMISTEFNIQGKFVESSNAMKLAIDCAKTISFDYDKTKALRGISIEYAKQGKTSEAFEFALSISDDSDKILTLCEISIELYKQKMSQGASIALQKAIECARVGLNKSLSLCVISNILAEQNKQQESENIMQEAVEFAKSILDESNKSKTLLKISSELAKQGKLKESESLIQEAINCAQGIIDKSFKTYILHSISVELIKQGNCVNAEKIGMEIPLIVERHKCWHELAIANKNKVGWQNSLVQSVNFQNKEAQKYYLESLADNLELSDSSIDVVLIARRYFYNDIQSMEKLLHKHALHELFFKEPKKEKLDRLNQTLNIQWAIDIKNQFN